MAEPGRRCGRWHSDVGAEIPGAGIPVGAAGLFRRMEGRERAGQDPLPAPGSRCGMLHGMLRMQRDICKNNLHVEGHPVYLWSY